MSYIENNLLANEKIIYFSRKHWVIFFTPLLVFCIPILLMVFADRIPASIRGFWIHLPGNINFIPSSMDLLTLAVVILFLLGFFLFINTLIDFYSSEFAVTDQRVIVKKGWLHRDAYELYLNKIEGIHVDQTIPGRIFDYGTLEIIGTGGTHDTFFYIPHALTFRKIAQEQVDKEK